MNVPNALTVDVEDYFHVAAFAPNIHRDSWTSRESRVVGNTQRLLIIFDQFDVRGTFFVLGWVAERHPQLVRDIAARAHEIACPGFSHRRAIAWPRAAMSLTSCGCRSATQPSTKKVP